MEALQQTYKGGPWPAAPKNPLPQTGGTESWHVAFAEAKGEDVAVVQQGHAFASGISLYAVADGHNGKAAARHTSLMLPMELEQQLGGGPASDAAVLQALARTFVATDDAICRHFFQSGCTLTAAVVNGDTLTVANVGDSMAILDTGAEVVELTADHRIGESRSEVRRLELAGGRLARLNEYGSGPSSSMSDGVGPIRLWPGGIMVGRAVGDRDVGGILLPIPNIRQIKLPPTGARLIIASDGLWDSVPAGRVARVLRNHSCPKSAAMQAVASVAASRGGVFTDDVTVVVVDILPAGCQDFKRVCSQFKGRLRSALSTPSLTSLAEKPEPAPAHAPAAPRQPVRRSSSSSGGLFGCFSKPAVRDDYPPDLPSPTSTLGSPREGSQPAYGSLHGGSERSVRAGVVRDPSVRGAQRATTIEVLADVDTALWEAEDFGNAPFPPSSRLSIDGLRRLSPSGVVNGLAGCSINSAQSEAETPAASISGSADQLPHAMSLAAAELPHAATTNCRKGCAEAKCHGGQAAGSLLQHQAPDRHALLS